MFSFTQQHTSIAKMTTSKSKKSLPAPSSPMSRTFSNNANTAVARSNSSSTKKSKSSMSTSAHKIKSELIRGRKYSIKSRQIIYYSCEIPTDDKKNLHGASPSQAAKIKKLQGKYMFKFSLFIQRYFTLNSREWCLTQGCKCERKCGRGREDTPTGEGCCWEWIPFTDCHVTSGQ